MREINMSKKESVDVKIDVHEEDVTAIVMSHPEVADYEIADNFHADLEISGIGFERKTVEDYNSSLQNGRLESQVFRMGQKYEHSYVLIDGDMAETESPFQSAIPGKSLRGSMASITVRENGIDAVIPCSNTELLVDTAIRLARKHLEEKDSTYIPTSDVDESAPTALKIYSQLSSIGPQTAKNLYEEYPTVRELMEDGDYESLQEVEGIGEERAMKILEELV